MLPREKLFRLGFANLSIQDLLAILIGTGGSNTNVFDLADYVYNKLLGSSYIKNGISLNLLEELKVSLLNIKSLGKVKTSRVLAAFELARRYSNAQMGTRIKKAQDIITLMHFLVNKRNEYVYGIYVDSQLYILKVKLLFKGGVDFAQIGMREVFAPVLKFGATGFFIVHNHPSGNFYPSREDKIITQRIKEISNMLEIRFLDHVIISKHGYYSFNENGFIAS